MFVLIPVISFILDEELQALLGKATGQEQTAKKIKPMCKKCGNPMKGHKKSSCQ